MGLLGVDISDIDGSLSIRSLPPETTAVHVYVNGVVVWKGPTGPDEIGEMVVSGKHLSAASHGATGVVLPLPDDSGSLVQVYALDAGRQPTAQGTLRTTHPLSRGGGCSRGPNERASALCGAMAGSGPAGRLFTSIVHAPGDAHEWVVPLQWLQRAPDEGEGCPFSQYFRLLLRCEPDTTADGVAAVGTVSFSLMTDEGFTRSSVLRRNGPDAEFAGPIPTDRLAEAEVRLRVVAAPACPTGGFVFWRYAVYGRLRLRGGDSPHPRPPSRTFPPGTLRTEARIRPWTSTSTKQSANHLPPRSCRNREGAARCSSGCRGTAAACQTDLEFCHDDIRHWYGYLAARAFHTEILGDEFSHYPRWDGAATVRNVRSAVRRIASSDTSPEDRAVLPVSSHGAPEGDDRTLGLTNILLLPDPLVGLSPDEIEGVYHDHEFAADLSTPCPGLAARPGRTFIFLDLCMSGRIIDDVLRVVTSVVGCTTATCTGVGYDSALTRSGAWTHSFLHRGLLPLGAGANADLVGVFREALVRHTATYRRTVDRPCFFARIAGRSYNTEPDPRAELPVGTFLSDDWL